MPKVLDAKKTWIVKCLAGHIHFFPKDKNIHYGPDKGWDFNGDFEKPTFTPSMRESAPKQEPYGDHPGRPFWRCHFIITDGVITMCSDCTGEFAGKTGPLPEFTQQEIDRYLSPNNDY